MSVKGKIFFVVAFAVLVSLIALFYFRQNKPRPESSSATSTNNAITLQADWELGSVDNIDSTTFPGSILMNDKASSNIDLTDPSVSISTVDFDSYAEGDVANLTDGNTATYWGAHGDMSEGCAGPYGEIVVDLGSSGTVNEVKAYFTYLSQPAYFYVSLNGTDYTSIGDTSETGLWVSKTANTTARYIKYHFNVTPCFDRGYVGEIAVTSSASATHTTGATQIDGGANFFEWESVTPTQTVPANTSITYRYRSSANGSDWNSWHSAIGDVESISGDTKYRYLQVEATLSNTDGVSTPSIDSYDIGYHTNLAPSTPTNLTAVVGE